jgi:predicted anti-sigma-YlaC factor YlaD
VSILNRLRLSAHLDDAALAAIWTDEATSGVRQAHPHLESCQACRVRFAELSAWLQDLRNDATAEADQHFSPERLAAQHALIFRRLEAAERPARVIAFPRFAQPLTSRTSHASRWVAAAAAAGLIVGVGVGQLMDLRHSFTSQPQAATAQARATGPRTPVGGEPFVQPLNDTVDETFLSELDATLSRASVPELRALDAFTPRADDRSR